MKANIKFTGFYLLIALIGLLFTTGHTTFAQEVEKLTYIKIEIDGLSCPFCAYGLEKNLKKWDGVEDVFISVEGGFATFNAPKDKQPTEDELKKIVKDAGFTARKISYSDKPFVDDEN